MFNIRKRSCTSRATAAWCSSLAEYVTPVAAWESTHAPGDQPTLMGHLLNYVSGPNRYGPDAFYEIHVWALKANPKGVFADWNSNVSCASWRGIAPF